MRTPGSWNAHVRERMVLNMGPIQDGENRLSPYSMDLWAFLI